MKITTSSIANTLRNTTAATWTKVATTGVLAAAVFMAAPTKAQAQIGFGLHFGGPVVYGRVGPVYAPRVYVRPYPVYRGYYGPAYGYGYRPYFHERFRRDWR